LVKLNPWAVVLVAVTTAPALIFAVWFYSQRFMSRERAALIVIVLLVLAFLGGVALIGQSLFL